MSWAEELYNIYEFNRCREFEGDEPVMLPVSHSTANSQVEIVIDTNGNFISASAVEKDDAMTIIPVTEDSGTRSSGIAPMPFADKLVYIAGDYPQYAEGKRSENSNYFGAYMEQLKSWLDSEHRHPAVKAVYTYLEKGCVLSDLIKGGVLKTDESTGKLLPKVKIAGIAQEDSFVRFTVIGDDTPQTWLDKTLYERFIAFNSDFMGEKNLCYATGEEGPVTYKHPSKIRNSGDKAKLFSSNDESGFSYRGRFAGKEQALSIGYVFSQKMHNALRWLIKKQGKNIGGLCVVAWASSMQSLPSPIDDDDFEEEEGSSPPSTMPMYIKNLPIQRNQAAD